MTYTRSSTLDSNWTHTHTHALDRAYTRTHIVRSTCMHIYTLSHTQLWHTSVAQHVCMYVYTLSHTQLWHSSAAQHACIYALALAHMVLFFNGIYAYPHTHNHWKLQWIYRTYRIVVMICWIFGLSLIFLHKFKKKSPFSLVINTELWNAQIKSAFNVIKQWQILTFYTNSKKSLFFQVINSTCNKE